MTEKIPWGGKELLVEEAHVGGLPTGKLIIDPETGEETFIYRRAAVYAFPRHRRARQDMYRVYQDPPADRWSHGGGSYLFGRKAIIYADGSYEPSELPEILSFVQKEWGWQIDPFIIGLLGMGK